jgi:hypothetical protein
VVPQGEAVTPLSDALTAAQRSALSALEKAYVSGQLDDADATPSEVFGERLQTFGVTDPVDVVFLCAALDVLREWGVSAPTMTERVARENGEPKKATEGQVSYIVDLLKKGNHGSLAEADLRALPFDRASELIDSLKAGTYDASAWDVPF